MTWWRWLGLIGTLAAGSVVACRLLGRPTGIAMLVIVVLGLAPTVPAQAYDNRQRLAS